MNEKLIFTDNERQEADALLHSLRQHLGENMQDDDEKKINEYLNKAVEGGKIHRDVFGINPILHSLQTAIIAVEEIGLRSDAVLAILLYCCLADGEVTGASMEKDFGKQVLHIIKGMQKVRELYAKTPTIESENFRNLFISFAEDMRVILIMIADRVNIMRNIRDTENIEAQHKVAEEASYLYAPIAHKLGLYRLKSELEDLSLKYLEREA